MLPDTTDWPPYFFTPRRRPSESRPLREEPPAFLWAMVSVSYDGRPGRLLFLGGALGARLGGGLRLRLGGRGSPGPRLGGGLLRFGLRSRRGFRLRRRS